MVIKLDLEKADDRLEWSFIHKVLHFFNFPPLWIKLIMSVVSSSSMPVLINGNITDTFFPSRGIRQGDPLSPYIFMLCMEYLSVQITSACENRSWSPIKTSRFGPARRFPTEARSNLSSSLGFPCASSFGTYLGCPIHRSRPTKQSFRFYH